MAKTLQVWMAAYKLIFAQYKVFPTEQEIARHFGDWEAPKYFGIQDVSGCFDKIDAHAEAALKKVALYPGAHAVLKSLKDSKRLALLTSSLREVIDAAIKHNRLAEYFEVVLAGEDVQNHKPHPEVIEKGQAKPSGPKPEAVMIGDSRKDLEAASNAGVDSILVYPKSHKLFYNLAELKAYKPTYIVSSLTQILNILK